MLYRVFIMARAPHLAAYGYFYDALSGEFLPPSDPQGRAHTLARLMTATFLKGEASNPHSYEERRTYTPVWAPISSIVRVCHDDDIRSLTLHGGQNELRVEHAPDGKGSRNVQVFTEGVEAPAFEAPLTGSGYKNIQASVAELAQRFFDAFPAQF